MCFCKIHTFCFISPAFILLFKLKTVMKTYLSSHVYMLSITFNCNIVFIPWWATTFCFSILPSDGHLDCLQLFITKNNATMNIFTHLCSRTCVIILGVTRWPHRTAESDSVPTSSAWGFLDPTSSQTLDIIQLSNFASLIGIKWHLIVLIFTSLMNSRFSSNAC